MKQIICTWLLALIIVMPAGLSANDKGWKAGAAAIDITPDLPMWMAGYGRRDKPGDEIGHPLYAKALAMEDSKGTRAVIVSVDILGIPKIVRKAVEEQLRVRYGLDSPSLLMNASHTHSGPEVRAIETHLEKLDPGRTDMVTRYRNELQQKITTVIGEALKNLTEADLAYSRGSAGFGMNRRADYSLPEDDFRHGKRPNPYGPVDNDVPVMQVTGKDGRIIAVLFGYACHSTTLGEYNFNGDYPGFAQHYIEEAHPGAVALFMAGCGADQNPHPRNDMVSGLTGLDLAKMHGRTLALAVEAALNSSPEPVDPYLGAVLEEVKLPYLKVPDSDELIKQSKSSNQTVSDNAAVLLEMPDREGKLPSYYSYPVQVLRFGDDITLIALASEVVVDYSLRLKREITGSHVWVAAYSNDFLGYIPSRRIWEEGGYEGGESMTFSRTTLYRGAAHPNIWDPGVEQRVISKVHELYGRLIYNNKADN